MQKLTESRELGARKFVSVLPDGFLVQKDESDHLPFKQPEDDESECDEGENAL